MALTLLEEAKLERVQLALNGVRETRLVRRGDQRQFRRHISLHNGTHIVVFIINTDDLKNVIHLHDHPGYVDDC
jgi:hypothetical protein